ncbi:MAG: flagellar basal-body rod protein FlgG [Bacteroidetes bacterium]|nr:flagellar basal-body rod protein FlgG [Bacteroidota bacterium]MBU1115121.1 flagellar basal-body rod protein FlgG [Bacteroidota bacterium]MBU1799260.1 flagellar basal-body rod protein FlgG [Bacteroidota bacterium]
MSTRALRTAASGMLAQQYNIEVISNNIANMNTTAFKRNKAEFSDLMYQEVPTNSIASSGGTNSQSNESKIQIGNGVQPVSTQKIFKQGDIQPTYNQFDLAINGEGFFQVKKADGSFVYTRDGSFKVNADGQVVTSLGYSLDPEIQLNEDTIGINITRDGRIDVTASDGQTETLGEVQLIRFMNPGGLKALGDNLFAETDASGVPIFGTGGQNGFGEVHQGFLESSNVDIVEEMISMISAQRAYELNSKTVKTVEEMMTMANNIKR